MTITLPPDILREAKHMAVEDGVPLSHFVADLVEVRVATSRHYKRAMAELLELMRTSTFELGPITWTRDDLHRR